MAVGFGVASLLLAGYQTFEQKVQGQEAVERGEKALERQQQAETVAQSAAGSQRQAQDAANRARRKKRPDASIIRARSRRKGAQGDTFLTEDSSSSMLTNTRYLG